MSESNQPAQVGSTTGLGLVPECATVYVCLACGKRSRDRYGYDSIDGGWDESCGLYARQCYVDALTFGRGGRVVAVADGGVLPEPPVAPRTTEQDAADQIDLQAEARKVLEAWGIYGPKRA